MATGCILGSSMIVMALWGLLGPPELGAFMAIAIGLATGFLGATIATFFWGNFGQSTLRKKLVVALHNQDWEVVFQTVRAPLSAFQPGREL